MKEALFYKLFDEKKATVQCVLCPKNCIIPEGKTGYCRVRKNIGGKLYSLIYSKVSSAGFDPIEKKPLYHFLPGSSVFSVGTVGCNFSCAFCQNWQISQSDTRELSLDDISPERVVELALRNHSPGIAYTYSEPLIWYEFVLDTSKLARKNNLKNILVSNGFINHEPLLQLLPYVDAINIDLKSFRNNFYQKYCMGNLDSVLQAIGSSKKYSHVEITNLIIPGLNDSEEEIKEMVDWIASIDPKMPLHFSRYYPCYKMKIPATPISTLNKARDIAKKSLKYVYIGNVLDDEANTTYCSSCQKVLIKRSGYKTDNHGIDSMGCCKYCGEKVVY